jgi:hypothetical protein
VRKSEVLQPMGHSLVHFWRSCWLKDEPIAQESHDANNLILWKCKSDRPKLRMIEPKKNSFRWGCPDGPLGVGSNADWRFIALERWDRMPLDHLASCVSEPVHELIKFSKREINLLHRLPWREDFYSDSRLVFGNSDPDRCIRHNQAPICQSVWF